MSEVVPFPPIDPDKNQIIVVVGRKGSGKSVWAREVFRNWPGVDKWVIDPHGDADPGDDIGTVTVPRLPTELPLPKRRGEHTVTRWIANPGADDYREELDRAVGLALYPRQRRTLTWIDEMGEVFPSNRVQGNARILLQQSRHYYASAILCGPRPVTVDPLVLAQADRVVMYDVPNPADVERMAAQIGVPPKALGAELQATRARGPYWYTMFVAETNELFRCPPIAISAGYRHAQQ